LALLAIDRDCHLPITHNTAKRRGAFGRTAGLSARRSIARPKIDSGRRPEWIVVDTAGIDCSTVRRKSV
jgi:hypothetical protein